MTALQVQQVFKVSGVPTHTFVRPSSFNQLKVALRTPGRGLIVEGPSGIGKSTAVQKVLEELGLEKEVTRLSARVQGDVEYIEYLPDLGAFGTVIIDDFHKLDDTTKGKIADLLKVTADSEDESRKLVIIGINEARKALIVSAPDLTNRLDVIRLEVEDDAKVGELIAAGERALNVSIHARNHIIEKSRGSFYVAQLLCLDACVQASVIERPANSTPVATAYAAVQRKVMEKQRDRFGDTVRQFARGTKFRPGGRAPYLHILRWLRESDSWSIQIPDQMRKSPKEKASVGVVLDRGFLTTLTDRPDIAKLLHFDKDTSTLSVEDPMLVFYLRALNWAEFIQEVGFTRVDHEEAYDVALSFAGEDRTMASHIRDALEDMGHSVFYDQAEQHRILGEDVEAYLGPIYASDSRFVVAILGEQYGLKRWTLFESARYADRVESGKVLPIWSTTLNVSATDQLRKRGGLQFDPSADLLSQAQALAETIAKKLAEL